LDAINKQRLLRTYVCTLAYICTQRSFYSTCNYAVCMDAQ